MQKHGLRVSKKNIFEFYEEHPNVCKKALNSFLKNKIDAIYLAGSDAYLPGFLEEIRTIGLKIPDDIAIISQDDVALPAAADVTAIKQPIDEMGKKAAEIAISAIEKNDFKISGCNFLSGINSKKKHLKRLNFILTNSNYAYIIIKNAHVRIHYGGDERFVNNSIIIKLTIQ